MLFPGLLTSTLGTHTIHGLGLAQLAVDGSGEVRLVPLPATTPQAASERATTAVDAIAARQLSEASVIPLLRRAVVPVDEEDKDKDAAQGGLDSSMVIASTEALPLHASGEGGAGAGGLSENAGLTTRAAPLTAAVLPRMLEAVTTVQAPAHAPRTANPSTGRASTSSTTLFMGDPMRCDGCRYGWNHVCTFGDVCCELQTDGTVIPPYLHDQRAKAKALAQGARGTSGQAADGAASKPLPGTTGAAPGEASLLSRALLGALHAHHEAIAADPSLADTIPPSMTALPPVTADLKRRLLALQPHEAKAALLRVLSNFDHRLLREDLQHAHGLDASGVSKKALSTADRGALLTKYLHLTVVPTPDALNTVRRAAAEAGASDSAPAPPPAPPALGSPRKGPASSTSAPLTASTVDGLLGSLYTDSLLQTATLACAALTPGSRLQDMLAASTALAGSDVRKEARPKADMSGTGRSARIGDDATMTTAAAEPTSLAATSSSSSSASAGSIMSVAAPGAASFESDGSCSVSDVDVLLANLDTPLPQPMLARLAGSGLSVPRGGPDAPPPTLRLLMHLVPGNEDAFFMYMAMAQREAQAQAAKAAPSSGAGSSVLAGVASGASAASFVPALLYGALRNWQRSCQRDPTLSNGPAIIATAGAGPGLAAGAGSVASSRAGADADGDGDGDIGMGMSTGASSQQPASSSADPTSSAAHSSFPSSAACSFSSRVVNITSWRAKHLSRQALQPKSALLVAPPSAVALVPSGKQPSLRPPKPSAPVWEPKASLGMTALPLTFAPVAARAPPMHWTSTVALTRRARHNASKLMLGRSRIDGTGLYVTDDIEMDDVIAEYTGEVIDDRVCQAREEYYESHGIADYMFRLGPDEIVDATINGCRARYMNHSCDPNCFAVITLPETMPSPSDAERGAEAGEEAPWRTAGETSTGGTRSRRGGGSAAAAGDGVEDSLGPVRAGLMPPSAPAGTAAVSGRRVFVYALRRIKRGEELTYDYQFPAEEKKVPCKCGAANCRGTLNKLG